MSGPHATGPDRRAWRDQRWRLPTSIEHERPNLMRGRCILSAIMLLASVAAASAQASQPPGMGITSPLGMTPSDSFSSSGAIPLGATELNPPGLSPLVMPCPNTASNAQFDGGGASISSGCGSTTANGSSGGSTASNSNTLTSGLTAGSSNGSGIPLGATDLGTPGESQNILIPNMSVAPCPSATSSTSGTSMIAPSNGIASAGGC